MTFRAVTPAPLVPYLSLYLDAHGRARPLAFKTALWQAMHGETIAFFASAPSAGAATRGADVPATTTEQAAPPADGAEEIIAAVCLLDVNGITEVAFHCTPAIVRHLVALIHIGRATRARLAELDVTVVARVRSGHEPGRRLAQLCGLHFARIEDGNEVFIMERPACK